MTQNINAEKIQESLAEAGLVLPGPAEKLLEGFQPTVDLQVSYAGNSVELGTSLPANECRVEPAISFAPEVQYVRDGTRFRTQAYSTNPRAVTSVRELHTR